MCIVILVMLMNIVRFNISVGVRFSLVISEIGGSDGRVNYQLICWVVISELRMKNSRVISICVLLLLMVNRVLEVQLLFSCMLMLKMKVLMIIEVLIGEMKLFIGWLNRLFVVSVGKNSSIVSVSIIICVCSLVLCCLWMNICQVEVKLKVVWQRVRFRVLLMMKRMVWCVLIVLNRNSLLSISRVKVIRGVVSLCLGVVERVIFMVIFGCEGDLGVFQLVVMMGLIRVFCCQVLCNVCSVLLICVLGIVVKFSIRFVWLFGVMLELFIQQLFKVLIFILVVVVVVIRVCLCVRLLICMYRCSFVFIVGNGW